MRTLESRPPEPGLMGAPTEQAPDPSDAESLRLQDSGGARTAEPSASRRDRESLIMTDETLKTTPLNAAHRALGARMVGFGGYDMPVQYEGVLAEHRWTREHAGLFDVSHMGQCKITGADAVSQFERLVPGDYQILKAGKQKYSLLLNAEGGVMDDLMAGKPDHDGLYVVVNAGN